MTTNLVKTGVALLDQALGGGVRPGSLVLALGEPTSGMEILAKQFAVAEAPPAAGADPTVVYWSADESEEELRQVMSRYGDASQVRVLDIASEYFRRVYGDKPAAREEIRVRGILPARKAGEARRGEAQVPDFLDEIVATTRAARPRRTVVDTLDFFTELYPAEEVVKAVRALRLVTHESGGILLITKVRGTSAASVETMLTHVADVVLDLRVEQTRMEFVWHLTVKKVRNEPQLAGDTLYNPTQEGLQKDTRRRV